MQKKTLTAVSAHGVFRPLEPPALPEPQRVTLRVSEVTPAPQEEDWVDVECLEEGVATADERVTLGCSA
jgi:hypothetical protein